ncbi:MAG: hypothetical protein OET90_09580 [Desulfuromonadales bacterium]|nr:hypothetical protein [Desulfuromonadales bacterium]
MKKIVLSGLISIALFMSSAPCVALEAASNPELEQELRLLAQSIDNLTRQLKVGANATEQRKLHQLDIAIAYLNFRSRRIEMFERELQSNRAMRNRLSDSLAQFQQEEDNLPQFFDGNQQEELRRAKSELELRKKMISDRLNRIDEEIILLENRIMEMQDQIDSVESFVQKNLDALKH